MNSPTSPAEIAAVILAELVFGIGFDRLVGWAHLHKLWHVSASVVIGVAATLLLPTVVWPELWRTSLLLAVCFTASGLPMIIGSLRRTVSESHKRRAWPTAASQARDAAVMDLTALATYIADKRIDNTQAVHRIYQVIGTLKSV
jgi:hypothetical protein